MNDGKVTVADVRRLIDDVETLQTLEVRVRALEVRLATNTKRTVELERPVITGVHLGIGLILAPFVLFILCLIVVAIFAVLGIWSAT